MATTKQRSHKADLKAHDRTRRVDKPITDPTSGRTVSNPPEATDGDPVAISNQPTSATALSNAVEQHQTPVHNTAHVLDRAFKANLAQLTAGITPAGLAGIYFDWLSHLALSPGKQLELIEKAGRKLARFAQYAGQSALDFDTPPCIEPLPQDRRFRDDAWRQWPYNLIYQSFLLTQQWWHNATTDIDGLAPERERVVEFVAASYWTAQPRPIIPGSTRKSPRLRWPRPV